MRHVLISLLALPALLHAAEPLNNAGLARTYVAESTCKAAEKPDTCKKTAQAVAEKALQEAEHPGTPPRINNPDNLPPPASLPPPEPMSSQEVTHRIETLGQTFNAR